MSYQICSRCVMDTTDKEIKFDESGVCNHCKDAEKTLIEIARERKKFDLSKYCEKIKNDGKDKKYDCIIGISGGVDSCYVMHLAKKFGLRPLAVHIDNGWNSSLSNDNIKTLLRKLDVDLYTYVVDWDEFRDLQLAFLKASTPDCEIPTDHMLRPVLAMVAHRYKCKYIIFGSNISSESILPKTWSHGHSDWKYIKNIQKRFGRGRLNKYPHFTRADMDYFNRKIEWFDILDYIEYDKEAAKCFLIENYDWKDYGGKHHESFYTKFYQTYILPVKFGYDKRRAHLSSLIVAGQLSREEALEEMKKCSYNEETIEEDIQNFVDKIGITRDEFDEIMKKEPKSYWDYPNSETDFMGRLIQSISKIFGGANS